MSLKLEARADNVMLVRQSIEGAVRVLGAAGTVVDDIKLAVTEACSNVVKYAYGDETGEMIIELISGDDHLIVRIRDFGEWREHDASGGVEVSGMGIPLMEAVTRSHEITRGEDGTEVTLEFALHTDDPRSAVPRGE
ncbi:MAG: ATP-binding protein [Solirubrobacterales bacterium]